MNQEYWIQNEEDMEGKERRKMRKHEMNGQGK